MSLRRENVSGEQPGFPSLKGRSPATSIQSDAPDSRHPIRYPALTPSNPMSRAHAIHSDAPHSRHPFPCPALPPSIPMPSTPAIHSDAPHLMRGPDLGHRIQPPPIDPVAHPIQSDTPRLMRGPGLRVPQSPRRKHRPKRTTTPGDRHRLRDCQAPCDDE